MAVEGSRAGPQEQDWSCVLTLALCFTSGITAPSPMRPWVASAQLCVDPCPPHPTLLFCRIRHVLIC